MQGESVGIGRHGRHRRRDAIVGDSIGTAIELVLALPLDNALSGAYEAIFVSGVANVGWSLLSLC